MTSNPLKGKYGSKKNIYNNPLPIFSTLNPTSFLATHTTYPSSSYLRISKSVCSGILDEASKSVWIVNQRDMSLLWQRGFFGKGSLSRSEPSWLTRRTKQKEASGSGALTAEEVTAKRRAERTQFKVDRANAIAAAQAEAEALFATTGQLPKYNELGFIPSVNRQIPPVSVATTANPVSGPLRSPPEKAGSVQPCQKVVEVDSSKLRGEEENATDLEIIHMEYLQLTLEEAFFLSWSLGCLQILDPRTEMYLPPVAVLPLFLDLHAPNPLANLSQQPDNPFLIRYVAYQYYRSLGWIVKGGIKFCVDYLLYKKGPVFHHAEFAVVICPAYEDPADEETSPFTIQNVKPLTWSWFNTLNRVNTQVKKSFVLAYVTIPSKARLLRAGKTVTTPSCLSFYTVREVVVRRFVPARVRD